MAVPMPSFYKTRSLNHIVLFPILLKPGLLLKTAATESYLPVVYAEKWLDFPESGIPVGFTEVITVINGGLFLWLAGFPKEWDSPWIFRCDYSMKRYFIGLSKG